MCHLQKSVYCLKKSPRAWFEKFSLAIENFKIKKCKSDRSIFFFINAQHLALFSLQSMWMILSLPEVTFQEIHL